MDSFLLMPKILNFNPFPIQIRLVIQMIDVLLVIIVSFLDPILFNEVLSSSKQYLIAVLKLNIESQPTLLLNFSGSNHFYVKLVFSSPHHLLFGMKTSAVPTSLLTQRLMLVQNTLKLIFTSLMIQLPLMLSMLNSFPHETNLSIHLPNLFLIPSLASYDPLLMSLNPCCDYRGLLR